MTDSKDPVQEWAVTAYASVMFVALGPVPKDIRAQLIGLLNQAPDSVRQSSAALIERALMTLRP